MSKAALEKNKNFVILWSFVHKCEQYHSSGIKEETRVGGGGEAGPASV